MQLNSIIHYLIIRLHDDLEKRFELLLLLLGLLLL